MHARRMFLCFVGGILCLFLEEIWASPSQDGKIISAKKTTSADAKKEMEIETTRILAQYAPGCTEQFFIDIHNKITNAHAAYTQAKASTHPADLPGLARSHLAFVEEQTRILYQTCFVNALQITQALKQDPNNSSSLRMASRLQAIISRAYHKGDQTDTRLSNIKAQVQEKLK